MHYYIDGYNLLFRVLKAGDDLQKQREEVIQDIEIKINLLKLDATLVFDSQYHKSESTRTHLNYLEIIFTDVGETADEFILNALREEPKPAEHTVVSSDKKLVWLAKRRLAKTESVEEFIAWLNRRYKNRLKPRKIKQEEDASHKLQKKLTSTKVKECVPKKQALPEHCFNFYLESFEKEYATMSSAEAGLVSKDTLTSLNRVISKDKKKSKKPKSNQEDSLSNLQRWQKAFERDISDDE